MTLEQRLTSRKPTVLGLITSAAQSLRESGVDSPRLDAELLLARALGTDRLHMYARRDEEVDCDTCSRFDRMVARRVAREPCGLILGRVWFYGLEFEVEPAVFVPRPETELVVGACLSLADSVGRMCRVLDLCTGAGAIAVSVAAGLFHARVWAVDADQRAIDLACRNARRHGVVGRIDFLKGDLFDPLQSGSAGRRFEFVLANPPYVRSSDVPALEPEVRLFDPVEALDGGSDGLKCIGRIIAGAPAWLAPGGFLIVEMGEGQAEDVKQLALHAGFTLERLCMDFNGVERVAVLRSGADSRGD